MKIHRRRASLVPYRNTLCPDRLLSTRHLVIDCLNASGQRPQKFLPPKHYTVRVLAGDSNERILDKVVCRSNAHAWSGAHKQFIEDDPKRPEYADFERLAVGPLRCNHGGVVAYFL